MLLSGAYWRLPGNRHLTMKTVLLAYDRDQDLAAARDALQARNHRVTEDALRGGSPRDGRAATRPT